MLYIFKINQRMDTMSMLPNLANFFAGAFLCNAIPHLASGLKGETFPTPFAKPRGVGHSSAMLNFFWGSFNLIAGIALLTYQPIVIGTNPKTAIFAAGFLVLGSYLSVHFGNVRIKYPKKN